MTHSTGELVVTQHAIDTIAGAYEQAAGELRELGRSFEHTYSRQPWGTLSSILQLQRHYEELALGEHNSAVVRLREYAAAAEELATWVRKSGEAILGADRSTASSITDIGLS